MLKSRYLPPIPTLPNFRKTENSGTTTFCVTVKIRGYDQQIVTWAFRQISADVAVLYGFYLYLTTYNVIVDYNILYEMVTQTAVDMKYKILLGTDIILQGHKHENVGWQVNDEFINRKTKNNVKFRTMILKDTGKAVK